MPLLGDLEDGALDSPDASVTPRPLARDMREGLPHGFVSTSTGRIAFALDVIDLKARLPVRLGHVFDSGLAPERPDLSFVKPLLERDHGSGWLSTGTAFLVRLSTGYLLVSAEDGVVGFGAATRDTWVPAPSTWTRYRSLRAGAGRRILAELDDGTTHTFGPIEGAPHLWLVRAEDGPGNAVDYAYRDGLLASVKSAESALTIDRPLWGAPAEPGTPSTRIVGIRDFAGRSVRYTYDHGRLTGFVDVGAASWGCDRDTGRVRLTDPKGAVVIAATFDASGRVRQLDTGTESRALHYAPGVTRVEEDAHAWEYAFDGAGYTRRVTRPDGQSAEYAWDPARGDLVGYEDPAGRHHEFSFGAGHLLLSYTTTVATGPATWRLERDDEGRVLRRESPTGDVWAYRYDTHGLLVGTSRDLDRDGVLDPERVYIRAGNGDVTAVLDPVGRRTEYTRDGEGRITGVRPSCSRVGDEEICPVLRVDRDAAGQIIAVHWPTGPESDATWHIARNAAGRAMLIEDPRGARWTIERDALGRIAAVTRPDGGREAVARDAAGRVTEHVGADGARSSYAYDAAGRIEQLIDPAGKAWRYRWDALGRLLSRADPEGRRWTYEYGALFDPVRQVLPGGQAVAFEYDAAGRLVARRSGDLVERWSWDAAGRAIGIERQELASGRSDRWDLAYDGAGNVRELRQSLAGAGNGRLERTMTWERDASGLVRSRVDERGVAWRLERDAWGRIVALQSEQGGPPSTQTFDPWTGKLVQRFQVETVRDEHYGYDALGDLTEYREHERGVLARDETFERDVLGRTVASTDRINGHATRFEYDTSNRVVAVERESGLDRFTWSPRGELVRHEWQNDRGSGFKDIQFDGAGLLIQTRTSGAVTRFTWDFAPEDETTGAVVYRQSVGSGALAQRATLDDRGRVLSVEERRPAGWRTRRIVRWLPGDGAHAVARTTFSERGLPVADELFLSDGSDVAARFAADPAVQKPRWSVPSLTSTLRIESGMAGIVSAVGPRGLDLLPTRIWSDLAADDDDEDPSLARLVAAGASAPVRTGTDEAVAAETPRATFSEDVFDDGVGTVLGRGIVTMDLHVMCLLGGHQGPWCPPGIATRVSDYEPLTGETACVGLDCPQNRSGIPGPEGGCGLTERSQALPPLRNDDTHPLGVGMTNGEYGLQVTDLVVPGRGIDLALVRTYRSQNLRYSSLGRGWLLNYVDDRIGLPSNPSCLLNTLVWYQSDGGQIQFPRPSSGRPMAGDFGRIAKNTDGTKWYYDVRLPDGTVMRYWLYSGDDAVLTRISRPGAGPIAVDWSHDATAQAQGRRPKPLAAIAYTCENQAAFNPVASSSCTPEEIARLEYDTEAQTDDNGYRLRTVRVKQIKGSQSTYRKVFYMGDAVAGTDYDHHWLDSVHVSELASDGTTVVATEPVASYVYAGRAPNPSTGTYWMDDNLVEIKDAAGQWLLRLAYQDPLDQPLLHDTVSSVTTPRRTTTFTYAGDTLNERPTFIAHTTLNLADPLHRTEHWFDEHGHLIRVRRPDNTELTYSYDYLGRMSSVVWPSGRSQRWIYASRTWGIDLEHPVGFGEIPAPGSGLPESWSCYEIEPLSNQVWRTHVGAASYAACKSAFSGSKTRAPLPFETETRLNWMSATASGDTTSYAILASYLTAWGIVRNEGDPVLPFFGTGTPAMAWFEPEMVTGRLWTSSIDDSGNLQTLASAAPVTTYQYNTQGSPTITTLPNGSKSKVQYWNSAQTSYAATNYGLPALDEVLASDGTTVLARSKLIYDNWTNHARAEAWLDGTGASERLVIADRTYQFRNRLVSETPKSKTGTQADVLGGQVLYRYDAAGRVIQKRIQTGASTWALVEYAYTTDGLVEREKGWENSSGATNGPWTGIGTNGSTERRFVYDAFGNPVQEAVRLTANTWQITRREFDPMNRVRTAGTHANAFQGADPPDATTYLGDLTWTEYVYWDDGQVMYESIWRNGIGLFKRVYHEYDGHGRPWREKVCADTGFVYSGCTTWLTVTEHTYDALGRETQTRVSGRLGGPGSNWGTLALSQTDYDERDRVIRTRVAQSLGGPEVLSDCTSGSTCRWLTSWTKYDVSDRPVRTGAPSPLTAGAYAISQITYDLLGRAKTLTDPLGNVVTLDRNNMGQATKKTLDEVDSATYDNATTKGQFVTEFVYDGFGRPEQVKLKDPASTDPNARRVVKRQFDIRGNLTAEWTPLGSAGASDPYKSEYTYDGLGRKTKERRHVGTSAGNTDGWQTTDFAYDDGGRLLTITATVKPSGAIGPSQVTTYAYDGAGRQVSRTLPDGKVEATAYDEAGRVLTTTFKSAAGTCGAGGIRCVTMTNTYGDAGRRTALDISLSNVEAGHYTGTTRQEWTYDGPGRIVESLDLDGTSTVVTSASHDSTGNVLQEGFGATQSGGTPRWTVGSTTGLAGLRATLTYPNAAPTVGYTYDVVGRLATLTAGATTVAQPTFVGADRMVRNVYGDGSEFRAYTGTGTPKPLDWDIAGRRTAGRVTTSGGAVLYEEQFGYDADDRVTWVAWPHLRTAPQNEVQAFTYDEGGRLTAFQERPGTWNTTTKSWDWATPVTTNHDWTLDELGNWRSHTDPKTVGAAAPTLNNINAYTTWPEGVDTNADGTNDTQVARTLTMDTVRGFLFDRQTGTNTSKRYRHDGLGRLTEVVSVTGGVETVVVRYRYDAAGRLAWKVTGSEVIKEWFVYDGAEVVQQFRDNNGTIELLWTNVWAGASLVRATDGAGGSTYVHQDRLGSNVLETRGGAAHTKSAYDPYGRRVTLTGLSATTATPYGYAGARLELATGLYLMGARWYDPEMGRFVEQDPIGEGGGLNLYAYVGASPTMWVDPSGLKQQPLDPFQPSFNPNSVHWTLDGIAIREEAALSMLESGAAVFWGSKQAQLTRKAEQVAAQIAGGSGLSVEEVKNKILGWLAQKGALEAVWWSEGGFALMPPATRSATEPSTPSDPQHRETSQPIHALPASNLQPPTNAEFCGGRCVDPQNVKEPDYSGALEPWMLEVATALPGIADFKNNIAKAREIVRNVVWRLGLEVAAEQIDTLDKDRLFGMLLLATLYRTQQFAEQGNLYASWNVPTTQGPAVFGFFEVTPQKNTEGWNTATMYYLSLLGASRPWVFSFEGTGSTETMWVHIYPREISMYPPPCYIRPGQKRR